MNIVLNDFIGRLFSAPLKASLQWKTEVVAFDSAIEQRNQAWSLPIRHWEFTYRVLLPEFRAKLVELYNRAKGRYGTFLFKDPDDYTSQCSFTQAKHNIIAVDSDIDYFMIDGNYAYETWLADGAHFKVAGSTGNNGWWTVDHAEHVSGVTLVYPVENISSAIVDGYLLPAEFQLFKTYYPTTPEFWTEHRHDIKPNACSVTVNGASKIENTHYTLDDATGIIKFLAAYVPTDTQIIAASFEFYFRVRFDFDMYSDSQVVPAIWNTDSLEIIEVK